MAGSFWALVWTLDAASNPAKKKKNSRGTVRGSTTLSVIALSRGKTTFNVPFVETQLVLFATGPKTNPLWTDLSHGMQYLGHRQPVNHNGNIGDLHWKASRIEESYVVASGPQRVLIAL